MAINGVDYSKYIGRKVKGFKFEEYIPQYNHELMDKHIGEIGKITQYESAHNSFKIGFKKDCFYYPAEETLKHLIEEETDVLKETPFHKPEYSHLGKFVNLSSAVKEKKETEFTHINDGIQIRWSETTININDPLIKKLYYHGKLECGSDLFVAETNLGLVILKGIVGDEFKLS